MGTIPKEAKKAIVDGYLAETWKVCLLDATFTYVSGTHVNYSDLLASGKEIVGTGYSAGGYVTNKTGAYSGTNYVLDIDNVASAAGSTFANVGYAVLYNTGGLGPIRDIKTISPAASVTAGTFTIQWNASGVLKVS